MAGDGAEAAAWAEADAEAADKLEWDEEAEAGSAAETSVAHVVASRARNICINRG